MALTGAALLVQPVHPDELHFFRIGAQIWQGYWPYTVTGDNKPPLIYGFYSALMPLAGGNFTAYRLIMGLVSLSGAGAIYLTGRYWGSKPAGFWAALAYLTLLGHWHGSYAITEPPIAALAAWIGWILVRWGWSRSNGAAVITGLLSGGMLMIKQPAISMSVWLMGYWGLRRRLVWFLTGMALIPLWIVGGFGAAGKFKWLWEAVIGLNIRSYPPESVIKTLVFGINNVWWPLAGFLYMWLWAVWSRVPNNSRRAGYLWGLLLASPWLLYRPYHHYWVLIIPILCFWLVDIIIVQNRWIKLLSIQIILLNLFTLSYSL